MSDFSLTKTDVENEEVEHTRIVNHRKIGNTTFEVYSQYATERTYEVIIKNALLREIGKDF